MVITYILIGIYALLTGIAGLQQWKGNKYQVRPFLFVVLSIVILVTLFIPSKAAVLVMLIISFFLLHMLAVAEGMLTNNRIRYSHHIIRFILHCILLLMAYKFIR